MSQSCTYINRERDVSMKMCSDQTEPKICSKKLEKTSKK